MVQALVTTSRAQTQQSIARFQIVVIVVLAMINVKLDWDLAIQCDARILVTSQMLQTAVRTTSVE